MPAVYPTSVKQFTVKQDITDVVEAGDVDDLQDEVTALQTILGTNPHLSTVFPTAYASVKERFAAADVLLNQIAGYFMSGGTINQSQVSGLGTLLSTLTDGVNNAATVTALASAISTVTSSINTETTNRTNADNGLQAQISSLGGSSSSTSGDLQTQIDNEIANRIAAINSEASSRGGADTSLGSRVTTLENRFKAAEAQFQNNTSRNYVTSSAYQSLYLPNQSFLTNDYGTTHGDGHHLVEIAGPQTRFYSDFSGVSDIYCLTVTVTWQGTGGSSNAGVRGVRIRTTAGSTLAEFIKNANQDPNDEALSVVFVGRLSGSLNYYIVPEVLQNSGATLSLRGHTSTTPTFATFTRIPG
jgi:hypothetical protein